MKYFNQFVLVLTLVALSSQIELELTTNETCLDYIVEYANTRKLFYFHFNHNIDEVNMVLMRKGSKQIWH